MTTRNPAGQALFKMQFGLMMASAGRIKEAQTAFQEATDILVALEEKLDAEAS